MRMTIFMRLREYGTPRSYKNDITHIFFLFTLISHFFSSVTRTIAPHYHPFYRAQPSSLVTLTTSASLKRCASPHLPHQHEHNDGGAGGKGGQCEHVRRNLGMEKLSQ